VIGIVHISDIHFVNGTNLAAARVQQIKAAVQSESHDVSDLLLLISGDVAYSGKQAEYSIAVDFVSELEEALRTIKGLKLLGTVVIPGNHDLDFDEEGNVRPVLLSTIGGLSGSVDASSDVVEQMLKVQAAFFSFEELVSTKPHPPAERLLWSHEFASSSGTVLVRCFNTAWVSRKKELQGQIFFPSQVIPDISATDAVLVVSTFHHPYGWLQSENARAFRRVVETSSDIVFTGHEHDGEVYVRTSSGVTVNYVEGAALQAAGVETGFNLAKVDLAAQTYQVRQFEWKKDMYEPGTLHAAMFTRNQAILEHQFVNNTTFREYLDDIGTPFSHPVKTRLTLSDLFVYPDLKVTTVKTKTGQESAVMSADVLDYVFGKRRLSIGGPPTSGKTSLAKTLYADLLQRKKLVPVLLQYDEIRGTAASQVKSAVERAFERQYSKGLLERFNQLDPQSKVVILDDWHKMKFSAKGKALILDALDKMFDRVVVLTNDSSILHQLTDAVASGELPNFEYCTIRLFGYRLRGELVTKWEALGREFEVEELELTHRISEGEYLLDTLIGKGIVPSFPFFIFSVLQADDPTAHNATYGSYGHIYQALLTTRMARVNPKKLGLKFTYLSLIAFHLFTSGRDTLTHAEARSLHEKYEKEYLGTVDQKQLLDELEAGQVLSVSSDGISFKYKYGYYYFVAHYFHDGISNVKDEPSLREKLKEIADNAYNDDNAHILIFYLYMSKDRTLIEHILSNAENLFASAGMSDLDKDLAFVNALYGTPPKLEAPSVDTDRNREEYRERRDEAANSEAASEADEAPETPGTHDVDFAFQSMNIMGQVLRNFPADLRADLKLRLTQESYHLGLRALRAFLRDLSTNIEAFRRDMFEHFKLLQPFSRRPSDADLQAVADKAVIAFTEIIVFGSIKKISVSVGVEELRDTYEAVRAKAGEDHVPTRMIDLAIKLDHFARIPERDVEDLKKRLQGNPAAYTTLRVLVGEFLYLFPVDHRVRQRMINLLDFQPGAATMSASKMVKKITAIGE
jgi:hypothetical protein